MRCLWKEVGFLLEVIEIREKGKMKLMRVVDNLLDLILVRNGNYNLYFYFVIGLFFFFFRIISKDWVIWF